MGNKRKAESSAWTIFKLFIQPTIALKPFVYTLQDWYDLYFHTQFREIHKYTVMKMFKMPGDLRVRPQKIVQGLGKRQLRRGQHLFVRRDIRDNFYDVEIASTGQVFKVSLADWAHVLPCMRKRK